MARVLVVDDEPGVRTALARGLVAEGMDVVAVGDGPSALRAALTGSFDAVVLDIILPGLSGYRVLERMRAAGVDTPVPVDGAWVPAYALVAVLLVAACLLGLVARFRKVGSR